MSDESNRILARKSYLAKLNNKIDDSWIEVQDNDSRKRRIYDSIIPSDQYVTGDSLLLSESTGYLSQFAREEIDGVDDRLEDVIEDGVGGEYDMENDDDEQDSNYDSTPNSLDNSILSVDFNHDRNDSSPDIDLRTSLSTIIATGNSKSKQNEFQAHPQHLHRMTSRVSMGSVRIISESEMKKSPSSSSAATTTTTTPQTTNSTTTTSSASSTTTTRRKRAKRRNQKSIPNLNSKAITLDISTITLAAASISLVAGISFSAGYALGKRSGMLRVAG